MKIEMAEAKNTKIIRFAEELPKNPATDKIMKERAEIAAQKAEREKALKQAQDREAKEAKREREKAANEKARRDKAALENAKKEAEQ